MSARGGFTLIEMICALAIMGLVAALALPAIPRGTSQQRLRAYAVEIASLLASDHVAAMRGDAAVDAIVDVPGRLVRAGASTRSVVLPADVDLEATLATRCGGARKGRAITFTPDGMSCGGVVALVRAGAGFEVRIDWLTGGIDIAPR